MNQLILHDYYRSSAAYRVRIALNLKNVDYQRRTVNLLESEQKGEAYRRLNPQALVPMLEIDGRSLTQSLAILFYLDSTRAQPAFLPPDPADAAHVHSLALLIACDIHPLNNLRTLRQLASMDVDPAARDSWYRHWIVEGFGALEALARPRAGLFLFGDSPSLADICLVPQMYNARRFDVPLDAFPTLVRADLEASSIPAFAAAHPDRVAPSPATD